MVPDKQSEGIRELLDLLPVLFAIVDRDGSIGWANRTFRDLFIPARAGSSAADIRLFVPGSGQEMPDLIRDVFDSGVPMAGIITSAIVPASGERTFRFDIIPCSGKQDPGFVILFATDLTEQAGMERIKHDTYEQIEKNIEQFAVLGDQLRNPVTVITGLCDLLEDQEIAETIRLQAGEINRTVTQIDQGWIESEKVRSVLRKYYDVGVRGTHELVARAIHEEYLAQQRSAGQILETNPSMRPWNELPRHLQESNLKQADDIWRKLSWIHCAIGIATESRPEPFEFTREEIELLAMREHERWMDERTLRGWSYGPVTNTQARVHNCLVPWEQLPEDQKEKDRNTVRTLPAVLAKVRLKVVRIG